MSLNRTIFVFIYFCLSVNYISISQELIPNGSFEEGIKPNKDRFKLNDKIPYWNKPLIYKQSEYGYIGSSFIARIKGIEDPMFLYDTLENCYGSLWQIKNHGAVLYIKLNSSLVKDSLYNLSFMINPVSPMNDTALIYNESLSFIFTKSPLKNVSKKIVEKNALSTYKYTPPKYNAITSWFNVNYQFKAKGNETYLYILDINKHNIKTTNESYVKELFKESGATYSIDNISLSKGTKSAKNSIIYLDLYKHELIQKKLPLNQELFCNTCSGSNRKNFNKECDTVFYTNVNFPLFNRSFINFSDELLFTLKNDSTLKLKLTVYNFIKTDDNFFDVWTYNFINYLCFYGIDRTRIKLEFIDNTNKQYRKDIEPRKYSVHNIGFTITN